MLNEGLGALAAAITACCCCCAAAASLSLAALEATWLTGGTDPRARWKKLRGAALTGTELRAGLPCRRSNRLRLVPEFLAGLEAPPTEEARLLSEGCCESSLLQLTLVRSAPEPEPTEAKSSSQSVGTGVITGQCGDEGFRQCGEHSAVKWGESHMAHLNNKRREEVAHERPQVEDPDPNSTTPIQPPRDEGMFMTRPQC